jgi:hypothetical protein
MLNDAMLGGEIRDICVLSATFNRVITTTACRRRSAFQAWSLLEHQKSRATSLWPNKRTSGTGHGNKYLYAVNLETQVLTV